jgi:hypothetical protein
MMPVRETHSSFSPDSGWVPDALVNSRLVAEALPLLRRFVGLLNGSFLEAACDGYGE